MKIMSKYRKVTDIQNVDTIRYIDIGDISRYFRYIDPALVYTLALSRLALYPCPSNRHNHSELLTLPENPETVFGIFLRRHL